jgi:hypothetical protein
MEKSPVSDAAVLITGGCLSACVILVVGAFLFKVWNERQMTHAYDRQAVALEQISDAVAPKECGTLVIPQFLPEEFVVGLRLEDGSVLELPANTAGGQKLCLKRARP